MPKTVSTEVEQAESDRARVMGKLKKVAELVARSPSLTGVMLESLELWITTFLEAHEAQRGTEREARWAKFESSQPRNALKTINELSLPSRFTGALLRKYPGYSYHPGLLDTTVPGYHRPHLLAGDIIQYSREEMVRLMGQGSAATMKAVESALAKHGLYIGTPSRDWIDYEQRLVF